MKKLLVLFAAIGLNTTAAFANPVPFQPYTPVGGFDPYLTNFDAPSILAAAGGGGGAGGGGCGCSCACGGGGAGGGAGGGKSDFVQSGYIGTEPFPNPPYNPTGNDIHALIKIDHTIGYGGRPVGAPQPSPRGH